MTWPVTARPTRQDAPSYVSACDERSPSGPDRVLRSPSRPPSSPSSGMLGVSLRHRGEELLALPGGLDGYRAGNVTGLPAAGPVGQPARRRAGTRSTGVVVDSRALDLPTDDQRPAHPRHDDGPARLGGRRPATEHSFDGAVRLRRAPRPPRLVPLPPRAPDRRGGRPPRRCGWRRPSLPTADRAVPVAFGYHPYLRLPGVSRERRPPPPARPSAPRARRRVGSRRAWSAPRRPRTSRSGPRTFDDLYELGDDRRLALTGGGRRLALELGDGYPYAQVFTPPDADSVCLEPMTAPVNALVDGRCALVGPGATFTARFSLHVEDTAD